GEGGGRRGDEAGPGRRGRPARVVGPGLGEPGAEGGQAGGSWRVRAEDAEPAVDVADRERPFQSSPGAGGTARRAVVSADEELEVEGARLIALGADLPRP